MRTRPTEQPSYAELQAHNARLQRELDASRQTLQSQQRALAAKDAEIAYLQERVALLLSKRYQAQCETLSHLQRSLFDEAELERDLADARAALEQAQSESGAAPKSPSTPRERTPKRTALPAHLKRVEVIVDVSPEQAMAMGDEWECVGYETSERLAVHQREYYVKVFKRKKYVRKCAARNTSEQAEDACSGGIIVAPPAPAMLPKAIADASVLSDVVASKFVDALSFVRVHKRVQREGIDIGYSTLCDWPIQLYERLLPWQPLWFESLRERPLWHLDETSLQVLKEPERDDTQKSYLWAIRAGPDERPVVMFHYATTRDHGALEQWLAPALDGFRGAIVSDEHGAYNVLRRHYPGIKAHGGCWYHARRKFADAAKGRRHLSDAHAVLKLIAELCRADERLDTLSGEDKRLARQKHVRPKVDAIQKYLLAIEGHYLSKGLMNIAIGYALNNWAKLCAFLEHPELPLGNNAVERTIRPFAVGRRNWLFSGSPRGARASAFVYSLVESAKANSLEPKAYLTALFERFPLTKSDDERRALLPFNFQFS